MKQYRILTQTSDPEIQLKLPQVMFDAIEQSAAENGRSFNTELLIHLSQSLSSGNARDLTSQEWMDLIFMPLSRRPA